MLVCKHVHCLSANFCASLQTFVIVCRLTSVFVIFRLFSETLKCQSVCFKHKSVNYKIIKSANFLNVSLQTLKVSLQTFNTLVDKLLKKVCRLTLKSLQTCNCNKSVHSSLHTFCIFESLPTDFVKVCRHVIEVKLQVQVCKVSLQTCKKKSPP